MKIIVTGANGQLGKEIIHQLSTKDLYKIFPCDIEELDITNIEDVNKFILSVEPNIVINCAAYTSVDMCEKEVDLAYKVNAIGPRNLAIACVKVNAKMVHISTDYVFDGGENIDKTDSLRPYCEFDSINPKTVYGKTKAEGEKFVKDFLPKHFIIRTAWLYGDGANFVRTMISLAEKHDELNVVDDQIGTPTSTYELSRAIISLIDTENYGLYHGTCQGQCSWYEFTMKIFEIMRIKTKVNPCTSKEFSRLAKRPHYSVLDNFMFKLNDGYEFAEWEDALKRFLIKE